MSIKFSLKLLNTMRCRWVMRITMTINWAILSKCHTTQPKFFLADADPDEALFNCYKTKQNKQNNHNSQTEILQGTNKDSK